MVSNARLDFPEPDNPVTTTRRSRGISTEMFLRLWTRAPWTATVLRTAGRRDRAESPPIGQIRGEKERQFLNVDGAPPREARGDRRLANQGAVGKILAGRDRTAEIEVLLEVILDLLARTRLARVAQILDNGREQPRRVPGHVAVRGVERSLNPRSRFRFVQEVAVYDLEKS